MTNDINPDQKVTKSQMSSDIAVPPNAGDEMLSLSSAPAHDGDNTQDTKGGMKTFRQYTVIIALFVSWNNHQS